MLSTIFSSCLFLGVFFTSYSDSFDCSEIAMAASRFACLFVDLEVLVYGLMKLIVCLTFVQFAFLSSSFSSA